MKFKAFPFKEEICKHTKECITSNKNAVKNNVNYNKGINQKDVFVMKADKGNEIVVMDRSEYERRALKLIEDRGFKKIKISPLSKMISISNKIRKQISVVFGERFKWRLNVPHPEVPKMFLLPKIHQTGDKMREIVSCIKSPCTLIAKWLVQEIKSLPKFDNSSVKNSMEFAKSIQTLDKPGIYEIKCNECERKYYGQPKRSVRKRFEEHNNVRNMEPRKSAFAMHAIQEQHLSTTIDNVRLLKCVNDARKLDAYESLHILRDEKALNADKGNIESDLFLLR